MELSDEIDQKITRLSETGDELADQGQFEQAYACYQEVFDLLPEPKLILEVATWLLTATTPKSTGILAAS